MMRNEAFKAVADFLKEKLVECPVDQQIKLYQALGEILPPHAAGEAKEIARTLSRAAALQRDFSPELFDHLEGDGR